MTKLTDDMRTCAAFILSLPGDAMFAQAHALHDAADLLIEASNALEACEATGEACVPLGEPMEIIEPVTHEWTSEKLKDELKNLPTGTWVAAGDTLPVARPPSPRACPQCDSRANKTVRRAGSETMLICPVCSHEWPYMKRPLAGGTGAAE